MAIHVQWDLASHGLSFQKHQAAAPPDETTGPAAAANTSVSQSTDAGKAKARDRTD